MGERHEKKNWCIFMSMILFFGVAVMGWTQQENGVYTKTIAIKNHITHLQQKNIDEKKTLRIIKAMTELKQFQENTNMSQSQWQQITNSKSPLIKNWI